MLFRIKKKLEGEINELEIALDHANKANSEAQKSIKRYQVFKLPVFLSVFNTFLFGSLKIYTLFILTYHFVLSLYSVS